jgi:APA family basic amino acid/polyamine antiporter
MMEPAAQRSIDAATPAPAPGRGNAPGVLTLTLTASGTAMASVCAVGLLQIEQLVGGLWTVVAILAAGALCAVIARALGRLSSVVPSGAGLLAYFSRGLNRRIATLLMISYLVMMLLLVGVEAIIVGVLVSELTPLPALAGALLFLLATWLVCQRGIQVGYRTQSIATVALFVVLVVLSIVALASAAQRGDLEDRLLTAPPAATAMVTAIGQAVFLMMGFELVTSHVEAAAPRAVGRALWASVAVLIVFYSVIALGLASLDALPALDGDRLIVPQIALAAHTGHKLVMVGVVAVCLLSSFTSFHGALLSVSLFSRALGRQGVLPRALARVDPRTMIPHAALNALFAMTALFTLVAYLLTLYQAAILGAAVVTASVYGAVLWTRERPPFREPHRHRARALVSILIAAGFAVLAIGVFVDAGGARWELAVLLLATLGVARLASLRIRMTQSTQSMQSTQSTQSTQSQPRQS